MKKEIEIKVGNYRALYSEETAGFPSRLAIQTNNGWEQVVHGIKPWLEIELSNGSVCYPIWPDDYQPEVSRFEEATRLEFINLPWQDQQRNILPGFRLCISYEFWPNGTTFVKTFFTVEQTNPPGFSSFKLIPPIKIPIDNEVSWSYWLRRRIVDGNFIQTPNFGEKNLRVGDSKHFKEMIIPSISFDFGLGSKRNKHLELLMEGANSLTKDYQNTATSVSWNGNNPIVEWNFLQEMRESKERPWQWRNQWGWILCETPRKLRHPPLRMYHYFDNYKHYPSERQIHKMAQEGADLLILHENWRRDLQNGEWPYDIQRLNKVVETAHTLGLRVALYVRGNELSIREGFCDWFERILCKDFDGLYMDYGSPRGYSSVSENFPGGRISFREHFLMIKRIRERIGNHGVLLLHTGPFFSACGLSGFIDGYVAGECEAGVLLEDRQTHAYFSSVSVAPGTLWTAAFPDYNSKKAIPFMASTGQSPHVILGTQFPSSSLAHPDEPGIVTYMRPLWRLWGIFSHEKWVNVLNEHNTDGFFMTDSDATGAFLMQAQDGAILLIASNFTEQPRQIEISLDWKKGYISSPKNGWYVVQLIPEPPLPKVINYNDIEHFKSEISGYGLIGWLLTPDLVPWKEKIVKFREGYRKPDQNETNYLLALEGLRQRRFEPTGQKQVFLRIYVPNAPLVYEDSMWWELYRNYHELVSIKDDGTEELIGYISLNGISQEKPHEQDYIWPGKTTVWIALHETLPPGKHDLAIIAKNQGGKYYSFVVAELSSEPIDETKAYRITFANELDKERSRLNFKVWLI
jgi:RimJ/RimL family protein N-acetyltransferase